MRYQKEIQDQVEIEKKSNILFKIVWMPVLLKIGA